MNNEEQKRIQEIQNRYKNFDINSNQKNNQNNYQTQNTSYEEFKKQKEEQQSVYQENIYEREKNNSSGMSLGTAIFVTLLTLFIIGTTSAYYLGAFDSFKKESTQIPEQKEDISDDSKIEKEKNEETAEQEKAEEIVVEKDNEKDKKEEKENLQKNSKPITKKKSKNNSNEKKYIVVDGKKYYQLDENSLYSDYYYRDLKIGIGLKKINNNTKEFCIKTTKNKEIEFLSGKNNPKNELEKYGTGLFLFPYQGMKLNGKREFFNKKTGEKGISEIIYIDGSGDNDTYKKYLKNEKKEEESKKYDGPDPISKLEKIEKENGLYKIYFDASNNNLDFDKDHYNIYIWKENGDLCISNIFVFYTNYIEFKDPGKCITPGIKIQLDYSNDYITNKSNRLKY